MSFAALAAIRLAVADTFFRADTVAAVRRAVGIQGTAPSAEFEERLADLAPDEAREVLERAVATNPRAGSAWIALGLLGESRGDFMGAERSLLQAAQVDRQYMPAWSLSNFYFRRRNEDLFWRWAARSAALVYDDFRPLLRLCDQFEPDPSRMLSHFGDERRLRAPYLDLLIGENRLDAAQDLARRMFGDHASDPLLIELADRQLRSGNIGFAIELWNVSSGYTPIDPPAGRILTNGDLAHAPLNLGFDWRMGQAEGIFSKWRPSELAFTLSGSQPELCVLLEQRILLPHASRLRFDYMTQDMSEPAFRWSLDDIEGSEIMPTAVWKEGAFDTPPASGLAHLRLFYRRESGRTRAEGRIALRNLRLEVRS